MRDCPTSEGKTATPSWGLGLHLTDLGFRPKSTFTRGTVPPTSWAETRLPPSQSVTMKAWESLTRSLHYMLQSFCTSISPAGYLTHTLLILTTPELGQGQGLKQGYPPLHTILSDLDCTHLPARSYHRSVESKTGHFLHSELTTFCFNISSSKESTQLSARWKEPQTHKAF